MSFQGDVAGIGLGELLQGLSRGGRDGVLTLHTEKTSAALGLRKGQLYLLSAPDEDQEQWRVRAHGAFADDPQPSLEAQRRQQIARAARLETIYQMLEAPNLHFRFEQGPLPPPPGHAALASKTVSLGGTTTVAPDSEASAWGPGLTVEYMLLEQARVSDESKRGPAARLSAHDIPRAFDLSNYPVEVRDFLEHCDGHSTIQEIADRLAWPLMQCRLSVAEYKQAGHIRLAQPRELLACAQRELELGRPARAATRFAGWVTSTPPGPPPPEDGELLVSEWESGRLGHILHQLDARIARQLLRKLDAIQEDPAAARDRWQALQQAQTGDRIAAVRACTLRLGGSRKSEARAFQDLLRQAHLFQQEGRELRCRALLRFAELHIPARPQARVELGKRMLETGLFDEGSRWLLETAQQLIDDGDYERAKVPVRAILRHEPEHAKAQRLLAEVRGLEKSKRRRRAVTLVGLSLGLTFSLVALVKFRTYREIDHWVAEINSHMGDPRTALEMIEDAFGENPPGRVADLRERLVKLKRDEDRRRYEEWSATYAEIEDTCRTGDPLQGLRQTLALEAPPDRNNEGTGFAERQDLLGILARRLGERSEELNLPPNASLEELNSEQRLADLLEEILAIITVEGAPPEAVSFHFRVSELRNEILERRDARANQRETIFEREKERQQDILLAMARAHKQAGDLERAVAAYERLLESGEELAGLSKLQAEIAEVRAHWKAVQQATEFAESGDHASAEAALEGVCRRPVEHLLPFQVDSRPTGAKVTMPGGRVRVTPFLAKAGIGEKIEMGFSYPDHMTRQINMEKPADLLIHLHRFPERELKSEHRIEAIPVPTGDDHVVADRQGRLMRLDSEGHTKWKVELDTLGGIKRTPTFLPGKPGFLLVISEDGQIWLIDASSGRSEGPHEFGAPPVEGPISTRRGISVVFANGEVGVWNDGLEPVVFKSETWERNEDERTSSNLVVLRNHLNAGNELASPWNDWKVEVTPQKLVVTNGEGYGFTAKVAGDWEYVAWEAPKAFVPDGRVWISDAEGLRSYLPTGQLVRLGDD